MCSSASTTASRYIPPHLRNRQLSSPSDSPSSSAGPSRLPSPTRHQTHRPSNSQSAPTRSQSRTPWSATSALIDQEHQGISSHPSSRTHSTEGRGRQQPYTSQSAPNRPSGSTAPAVAPTLHVFGDSFVGPLKLLEEDCARITTFKGSSAKVGYRFTILHQPLTSSRG
jgi:hypothetical protein